MPATSTPPPPPSSSSSSLPTLHHKSTDRDTRLKIRTLHDIGWSATRIAREFKIGRHQVQYALHHPMTPGHQRSGRHSAITPEEKDHIINWICNSEEGRQTTWEKIPVACGLPHIGWYAVRNMLRREGFKRVNNQTLRAQPTRNRVTEPTASTKQIETRRVELF